jgi:hypothetical protein
LLPAALSVTRSALSELILDSTEFPDLVVNVPRVYIFPIMQRIESGVSRREVIEASLSWSDVGGNIRRKRDVLPGSEDFKRSLSVFGNEHVRL